MSEIDMMRHWGRRDHDDERHSDADSEGGKKRFRLPTISEEPSHDDLISHQTRQEDLSLIDDGGCAKSEEQEGASDEDTSDHNYEVPHNDFQGAPLHTTFGALGDGVMLNTNTAAAGGKYRTVSIFGGVFDMPDPSGDGDADSMALSSSSDFSDDFSPPPPKPKPKEVAQQKNRIIPSRDKPKPTVSLNSGTSTSNSGDVSKALRALDEVERQVNDIMKELESTSLYPAVPIIFGEAIACFDDSKQSLESSLMNEEMKEDLTLSC
jgi:hypothetical protein